MFPGYHYMDPSWMGWMIGGSILFWIAVVALVIFTVARLSPTRGRGGEALDILDQRLARGEIGSDEYRSRRGLLGS